MSAGSLFFALCALVALLGAIWTITARNPIRGAVGLLATILGIAGLFLRLNAQFLAAIQLIVYAGAVVVLFVFVIMLLGPDAGGTRTAEAKSRISRFIGAALLAALVIGVLVVIGGTVGEPTTFGPARPEHGSVAAVGGLLFGRAIVAFELATALLIVAVVGAIAVARARRRKRPELTGDSPTQRMFHGPLHPRDAERPLPKKETAP
jgi:NADH-quinone oxidoreductase subunit J